MHDLFKQNWYVCIFVAVLLDGNFVYLFKRIRCSRDFNQLQVLVEIAKGTCATKKRAEVKWYPDAPWDWNIYLHEQPIDL